MKDLTDEQIHRLWEELPGIEIYNAAAAQGMSFNELLRRKLVRAAIAADRALNAPADRDVMLQAVTEEMAAAYLTASNRYWRETDKWRNGTALEATRVSLEAALAAAPTPPAEQGAQEPVAWAVPCSRACADGSMEDGPVQFVDHASSGEYSKRIGIPLYTHLAPNVLATLRAKVEELPSYRGVLWAIRRNDVLALIDKMVDGTRE